MQVEKWRVEDIKPFANNSRVHDEKSIEAIKASLDRFSWLQPICVDKDGVIIAGHGRLESAKELGMEEVPVLVADWLTENEVAAAREADNMTQDLSFFDMEQLNMNLGEIDWLDIDMTDFGFKLDDELITMEQRIANDTREEGEEYQEFVDKFVPKKTTDDCFTPPTIYEVVKDWACEKYGIDPKTIVRPFYPGGDYEAFDYPDGCCVLDNPPFSILSEIQRFYVERGIDFFLFAPYLTNLGADIPEVNHIICNARVVYENGAVVATCFLTTYGDDFIVSAPDLNQAINEETERLQGEIAHNPKYIYPDNLLTSARISNLSNNGVEFALKKEECHFTRALDQQKENGKGIYGSGYLISDSAAARLAQAEQDAQAEPPIVWELSDREREIIAGLE